MRGKPPAVAPLGSFTVFEPRLLSTWAPSSQWLSTARAGTFLLSVGLSAGDLCTGATQQADDIFSAMCYGLTHSYPTNVPY